MKLNLKKNRELGLPSKRFENYSFTLCHMLFGLSVLGIFVGTWKAYLTMDLNHTKSTF